MRPRPLIQALLLCSFVSFSAVADDDDDDSSVPGFIKGPILHQIYDGVTDDLLTAGLGKTGLTGATPGFVDPAKPTAAELRRHAIYSNYRALVDITSGGGYGVLYGPNIDNNGNNTLGEGKIAGDEFLAFADNGTGKRNVTLMVQVPASFNPGNPCIITATSSGSRGIYGAVGTAGDWGLKQACAVAYTDKGTGMGVHDLQNNTVNLIDGTRADAAIAGTASNFTAKLSKADRAAFNAATPNRFAWKHAHSRQNPERRWGNNTLQAVKFAFYVLSNLITDARAGNYKPKNTLVIASSVSNGGAAAIRAAERDSKHLIDGVAVSEPNVNPKPSNAFSIIQGSRSPVTNHSKSLYDYATQVNLFQPCANLTASNASAPLNLVSDTFEGNRCQSLKDKGLLTAATPADQANEAQAIINSFGILTEQNIVQPSHYFLSVPQSISVTYANAYGKLSVADNLCGYSFGATDASGNPVAAAASTVAQIFANGNGIPPTGGTCVSELWAHKRQINDSNLRVFNGLRL
jgi:hydroxybutyrate-dimer hydrolase